MEAHQSLSLGLAIYIKENYWTFSSISWVQPRLLVAIKDLILYVSFGRKGLKDILCIEMTCLMETLWSSNQVSVKQVNQ